MMDVYYDCMARCVMEQRVAECLRQARVQEMLRQAGGGRPGGFVEQACRLLGVLGTLLVAWGQRLQRLEISVQES